MAQMLSTVCTRCVPGVYPVCIWGVSGVSPMALARATGDPAERLKRDEPQNTRQTRKGKREEVSFPRISSIPRSIPPSFGFGFAALCLCVGWTAFLLSFRFQLSGLIPQPFTISIPNTTRLPRLPRGGLGALWTYPGHTLVP